MTLAATVDARGTGSALAARHEHLDSDPVAKRDAPAFEGVAAGPLDNADDLVTGDETERRREVTGVLLVVGAAQTARLDAEDPVVLADLGERKAASLNQAGPTQHRRLGEPAAHRSPPPGRDRRAATTRHRPRVGSRARS